MVSRPEKGGAGKAGTVETGRGWNRQSGHGVGHGGGIAQVDVPERGHLDGRFLQIEDMDLGPQLDQVTDSGGPHAGATTSAHENPLAFVAPHARHFPLSLAVLVVSVFRRFSAPQCGASAAHPPVRGNRNMTPASARAAV